MTGNTVKKTAKEVVNEKNIIFVVKGREASREIRTHNKLISLPSSDEQKRGFYHEDAKIIIETFPDFYKAFVKKGE